MQAISSGQRRLLISVCVAAVCLVMWLGIGPKADAGVVAHANRGRGAVSSNPTLLTGGSGGGVGVGSGGSRTPREYVER